MYGEGRTRGKCSELLIAACTNQACAAIVFREELVVFRPFVKLFLTASYESNRRLASGGVQPNLSLGLIKRLEVPLPPVREQVRIVDEVQRRLSVIAALKTTMDSGLHRAATLRRQILAAAFTGELFKMAAAGHTNGVSDSKVAATLPRVAR
jgi:type I restriction enzyme S subunit